MKGNYYNVKYIYIYKYIDIYIYPPAWPSLATQLELEAAEDTFRLPAGALATGPTWLGCHPGEIWMIKVILKFMGCILPSWNTY